MSTINMPPGPMVHIPDHIEQCPTFDVALSEICEIIPPEVVRASRPVAVWIGDVRSLMVLAWMRGATWQREQSASAQPVGEDS